MVHDKSRLFSLSSFSDRTIEEIKWEFLLVMIAAILVVLIITLICEYSDDFFRCRHHEKPQMSLDSTLPSKTIENDDTTILAHL